MKSNLLSQETLKQLIEYHPLSGEFYRLPKPNKIVVDAYTSLPIEVGERASKKELCIDKHVCNTLDVLWLYHKGHRPTKRLQQLDNHWYNIRMDNIRASTHPNTNRLPPTITQQLVKQLLHYNYKTGELYWRYTPKEKHLTGTQDELTGYMSISVAGTIYPATRLAWLYMMGEFPNNYIRFRNCNGFDYRWANLYESQPLRRHPLNHA